MCQTHASTEMTLQLPGHYAIQNPCKLTENSNDLRRGCVMFFKMELTIFLFNSGLSSYDTMLLTLSTGYKLLGIYKPPLKSAYFKDQFDHLLALSTCEYKEGEQFIVCGDVNSRMVSFSIENYEKSINADTYLNQNN